MDSLIVVLKKARNVLIQAIKTLTELGLSRNTFSSQSKR